jgi:hypothetical protein
MVVILGRVPGAPYLPRSVRQMWETTTPILKGRCPGQTPERREPEESKLCPVHRVFCDEREWWRVSASHSSTKNVDEWGTRNSGV